MAANTRQITAEIKRLLRDAGLDYSYDFRVTTKVQGIYHETVVLDCHVPSAKAALAGIPDVTFDRREYDGALVVRQPL